MLQKDTGALSYKVFILKITALPRDKERVLVFCQNNCLYRHYLLIQIFAKNCIRLNITSCLIRSGFSNHLSSPSKGQSSVGVQVLAKKKKKILLKHSTTRILSSSVTGCHPKPTHEPIGKSQSEASL